MGEGCEGKILGEREVSQQWLFYTRVSAPQLAEFASEESPGPGITSHLKVSKCHPGGKYRAFKLQRAFEFYLGNSFFQIFKNVKRVPAVC